MQRYCVYIRLPSKANGAYLVTGRRFQRGKAAVVAALYGASQIKHRRPETITTGQLLVGLCLLCAFLPHFTNFPGQQLGDVFCLLLNRLGFVPG